MNLLKTIYRRVRDNSLIDAIEDDPKLLDFFVRTHIRLCNKDDSKPIDFEASMKNMETLNAFVEKIF